MHSCVTRKQKEEVFYEEKQKIIGDFSGGYDAHELLSDLPGHYSRRHCGGNCLEKAGPPVQSAS